METMAAPPQGITLRRESRLLRLEYADAVTYELPFEYLRVYSPSAEVRGHGAGQEVLQTGKEDVNVVRIEPIGHYAIRLEFSDGHNTGLYTWAYLRDLAENHALRWTEYLDRLAAAGYARKP